MVNQNEFGQKGKGRKNCNFINLRQLQRTMPSCKHFFFVSFARITATKKAHSTLIFLFYFKHKSTLWRPSFVFNLIEDRKYSLTTESVSWLSPADLSDERSSNQVKYTSLDFISSQSKTVCFAASFMMCIANTLLPKVCFHIAAVTVLQLSMANQFKVLNLFGFVV